MAKTNWKRRGLRRRELQKEMETRIRLQRLALESSLGGLPREIRQLMIEHPEKFLPSGL